MTTTPRPLEGCDECRKGYRAVFDARGDSGRARRNLAKYIDHETWADRYRQQAIDAVALAEDAESRYAEHHATEHHGHVAPEFVDSYVEHLRRAPSHRGPEVPQPGELAAMLRAGATIEDLAEQYQRHASRIRHRLTGGGFSSTTGLPHGKTHNPDGLPTLARLFKFSPWVDDALCAQTDPDMFFPDKGGSVREAKAICARCPVAAECLDYALEIGDDRFGVYGGLTPRERRRLTPPPGETA